MSNMVRRAFVTLLGGAAIWPHAVLAEKRDEVRRIGVIMGFAEDDEVWQTYLATFRQALQELGWTDGRNIRFDYRFTRDSEQQMRNMAEDIVALSPDVILASTNSVVSATLNATRSIGGLIVTPSALRRRGAISLSVWRRASVCRRSIHLAFIRRAAV